VVIDEEHPDRCGVLCGHAGMHSTSLSSRGRPFDRSGVARQCGGVDIRHQ